MKDNQPEVKKTSNPGLLTRFAHLLSAQVVEGIFQTGFVLYLAWIDTVFYGELWYALSVSAVVTKLVHFGLYYPLVEDLSKAKATDAPVIMNRTNVIKLSLLVVSMLGVVGIFLFKGFSYRMIWIIVLITLGFGVEVLVETLFAELRVRGQQKQEARIRIASSVGGYGFGLITAALGFNPIIVVLFKLVSCAIRIVLGLSVYFQKHTWQTLFAMPQLQSVWLLFRYTMVFALIQILGTFYNKTNIFFLQNYYGTKAVSYYSATYSLVDAISMLASEQLLGWVIFPFLSVLWWNQRDRVAPVVRGTAQWLLAIAFPIMLILALESELIIGLLYPSAYVDAVWMQKYLVWTILFSFENNLFLYLMIVAGKAKRLLVYMVITTMLNLLFNVLLIPSYGLTGTCMVIIYTKMIMTMLTMLYCQFRYKIFSKGDFLFPIILAGLCYVLFILIDPLVTLHPALIIVVGLYCLVLWRFGERFLGPLSAKGQIVSKNHTSIS